MTGLAGCALAVAAACAAPAEAATAGLRGTTAIAAGDGARESALAAILAMREAETAGDAARLSGAATAPGRALTAQFARFAQDAVRSRRGATTGAGLAAVEDALARGRKAIADSISDPDAESAGCARELLLQCAEDLLLRRLAADGSDARIAVGLLTPDERRAIGAVVDEAQRALSDARLAGAFAPSAELATDPVVFRARLLAGIAAATQAELAREDRSGANWTRARRLLDEAARSELRVPPSVAAVLALARARAGADGLDRDARARLLAIAGTSGDPLLRFAAEVVAWQAGDAAAAFPPAPGRDASATMLAALAEWRARRARGQSAAAAATGLERFVRSAGLETAGERRAGSAVAAAAARLDADDRQAIASDAQVPLVVFALAAVHPDAEAMLAARADELASIARDPPTAEWLAIPLSRVLAGGGRTVDAGLLLASFASSAEDPAVGRAALGVALDLSRSAADRSAGGEVALDAALAVAGRRFSADPASEDWMFERIDRALFPRWSSPDPALASRTLASVPASDANRERRALRMLEIEAARSRESDAAAIGGRAESLARSPLSDGEAARAELVRATMLARMAREAEAIRSISRVLAVRAAEPRTHARAAALWLDLAARAARTLGAPSGLASLARENAEIRALVGAAAESGVDAAIADMRAGRPITEACRRLAPFAPLSPAGLGAGGEALVAIAAGRPDDAVRIASAAPESDRESTLLHAEALRMRGADGDPERAFEILRALAPLRAETRDGVWWAAQCGQLEILSAMPGRASDVVARINRLAALDSTLGGDGFRSRLDTLRRAAEDAMRRNDRKEPPR